MMSADRANKTRERYTPRQVTDRQDTDTMDNFKRFWKTKDKEWSPALKGQVSTSSSPSTKTHKMTVGVTKPRDGGGKETSKTQSTRRHALGENHLGHIGGSTGRDKNYTDGTVTTE
jgi:hypothetical protein